jgi:tol-pal system protein YbgF
MKFILAVLLIVIAAGPAYPENKDLLQLQSDIIQLSQQVKQIQTTVDQNNSVMKGLVEHMADQVNMLAGGMQKITATVDGLKSQNDGSTKEMRQALTTLSSTVGDLKDDMSAVRDTVNSLSKQITSMKTTSEPLAKPEDLWRSAYLDYSAGNYDLAIGDFQDFLSKFPTDDRAAEAHLMMAETLAAQKKYDQALNEYDIVLQKYPDSDKSKTALLKKGYALADSNQAPQAISTLKEVVTKYPNTTEATAATARLKELTAAGRKTPAKAGGAK